MATIDCITSTTTSYCLSPYGDTTGEYRVYRNTKYVSTAATTVLQYPIDIYTPSSTATCYTTARASCETDWDNYVVRSYVSQALLKHMGMTPIQKMRDILASRQSPMVLTSRRPVALATDIREIRARETLKKMLGDAEYRLFLKNGFVSVRGKSGRIYQIFPGHDFTRVFENGKCVEELCIILNQQYPPTDSLLMRYCILLNDEEQFCHLANRHRARNTGDFLRAWRGEQKKVDHRPLQDILFDMRNTMRDNQQKGAICTQLNSWKIVA